MPNQMEMFEEAMKYLLIKIEKYFAPALKMKLTESPYANCLGLTIGYGNIEKTYTYKLFDYQDIMCISKYQLLKDILEDIGHVINAIENIY